MRGASDHGGIGSGFQDISVGGSGDMGVGEDANQVLGSTGTFVEPRYYVGAGTASESLGVGGMDSLEAHGMCPGSLRGEQEEVEEPEKSLVSDGGVRGGARGVRHTHGSQRPARQQHDLSW